MITLQIKGNPVAQGRPRAFRRGNHIRMYDPATSKSWKQSIAWQANQQLTDNQKCKIINSALQLELLFLLPRPKSLSKKVTHHVKRPDLDNLIKAVKDALNGICYKDDSQIVKIYAEKIYAPHTSGVLITIREM